MKVNYCSFLWRTVYVCMLGYVELDVEMRNMTRYELTTVRLRCDITGFPLPNYRWYRDGRPLTPVTSSSSSRLDARTTSWGSRSVLGFYLHIKSLA